MSAAHELDDGLEELAEEMSPRPERAYVSLPGQLPAAVRTTVTHRRTKPFSYGFTHRTTAWVVDAAEPDAAFPRWLRPLASIRPSDHFGADDRPLDVKVRAFLDAQGLDWATDRVVGLCAARSLGHVFDPLSVWFCFDADGEPSGVLAEVHNTYGERHTYPLPIERGSAAVDKDFYVSPFFTVEGRYDIRVRLDSDRVAVAISLTQDDEVVFTGSEAGDLRPVRSRRDAVRAVLRDPAPALRVAALIRWHGIKLWLRRLPVVRRLPHATQEGMS